ncbi:hypothetical protein J2847_006648 [Azospirillum agricola]|uniref:hypothetical protein n=1 Tax=Azospirillum agricola TaxID=1720247 RepID=UPI001AE40A98|nr:hypothetical protein [Azospirillum agricola]MBP2233311.1 hypothetical protein [Azospirillum agricola]
MTKLVVRQGPLSTKMYCAIGMVAVSWAHLEEVVSFCLSRLLGVEHVEFLTISANMQVKARLDSIKALAGQKLSSQAAAQTIELCEQAIQLSKERNRILHGSWLQGETPDVGIRLNYRAYGRVTYDSPEMSAKEIAIVASSMNEVGTRMMLNLQQLGLYDPRTPMKAPTPAAETPVSAAS